MNIPWKKESNLDAPINRVLTEMAVYDPNDAEFEKQLTYLERLHALKEKTNRGRVSPDTMAVVLGNLAGILIIVAYEQKHVMVSKGLTYIPFLKSKTMQ